jgi:hypothetical protein
MGVSANVRQRLSSLEGHLQQESPVLVSVVKNFRVLDKVGYSTGLLDSDESFATRISWWPLISVLGTFSSGKSTFINHFVGQQLQSTGNQAVDDKFTVICFSDHPEVRLLPGLALDADPRFPFYQFSEELEKVVSGEGARVDAYLQLKTCPSEQLRGRIIIDSPGFDADAQRSATLRITDHIIDLSDLVLVFFDARHPEPGAMGDTLQHLVSDTIKRPDSNKFLYILNQLDTTAREDNPEEVIGAWQRALAQEGLTAGRFYCIYSPDAAVPIDDPAVRDRYESKRNRDLNEIHERVRQIGVERAYRIIGSLEKVARDIEEKRVPQLRERIAQWRRSVLWTDAIWLVLLSGALLAISVAMGYWDGLRFAPPWLDTLRGSPWRWGSALGIGAGLLVYLHYLSRKLAAGRILRRIRSEAGERREAEPVSRAFVRNTRFWRRSIFSTEPAGWNRRNRKRLREVIAAADDYVQILNNQFANPSGVDEASTTAAPVAAQSGDTTTPAPQTDRPEAAPVPDRESN